MTVRDRTLVFLFGGQGSQYYQMGKELFRENATFHRWMERGDRLVAARTGCSVIDELYAAHRSPGDPFDDFEVSHPSLFLFQYALARTFIEDGVRPDAMLGVSLGEVVACALLDVFDFDTALASVAEQARSIVRAAPRGGLITILGPRDLFDDSPLLRSQCEISGDFAPEHFVVACPQQSLGEVETYLRARDVLHVVLPLHHPFHSGWMEPLRGIPGCVIEGTPFGRPTADFVSCTEAARLEVIEPDHFWWTLRKPIAFRASIRLLEDAGACRYVDLTPGGTLAHLARANFAAGSGSESHAVNSPFGRDAARWEGIAAILRAQNTSTG